MSEELKGTDVSDELSALLDKSTGLEGNKTSEKELQAKALALYSFCTWHGGCYYCKDGTGRWKLMYCVA